MTLLKASNQPFHTTTRVGGTGVGRVLRGNSGRAKSLVGVEENRLEVDLRERRKVFRLGGGTTGVEAAGIAANGFKFSTPPKSLP